MGPIRHRRAPPQHEAGEADRQAGDGLLAGPLGVERPGRQHDEQRLCVGEHGGDAGGEVLGTDVHGGGADRCVGEPEPGDDRPLEDPPRDRSAPEETESHERRSGNEGAQRGEPQRGGTSPDGTTLTGTLRSPTTTSKTSWSTGKGSPRRGDSSSTSTP